MKHFDCQYSPPPRPRRDPSLRDEGGSDVTGPDTPSSRCDGDDRLRRGRARNVRCAEHSAGWLAFSEAVSMGMLQMAKVGRADTMYDLGSDDGRIVIAAAKHFGALTVGIDIDPSAFERRESTSGASVADRPADPPG